MKNILINNSTICLIVSYESIFNNFLILTFKKKIIRYHYKFGNEKYLDNS